MRYAATITVLFPASAELVFKHLINLKGYPLWNSGMRKISMDGSLREGMKYQTTSVVLGHENEAIITAVQVKPSQTIELVNNSGAITYHARYNLVPLKSNQTNVVCSLEFELKSMALNFAHGVIESMAKSRITGDLETLRAIIEAETAA